MNELHRNLLLGLCKKVYEAQEAADDEYKREMFGDRLPFELILRRVDAIRIEIRKEHVNHHEPHMHIKHSDKFDVSLCLTDFRVLAGDIDSKTLKKLKPWLELAQPHLMGIWNALNVDDDHLEVERLMANLPA